MSEIRGYLVGVLMKKGHPTLWGLYSGSPLIFVSPHLGLDSGQLEVQNAAELLQLLVHVVFGNEELGHPRKKRMQDAPLRVCCLRDSSRCLKQNGSEVKPSRHVARPQAQGVP